MAKITAPVAGFNGTVVGVVFTDGIGNSTDAPAVAYFKRHGYTVEGKDPTAPAAPRSSGKAAAETPKTPEELAAEAEAAAKAAEEAAAAATAAAAPAASK